MTEPAPHVIRTERVEAIAEDLRRRPVEPAAVLGLDCPVCGILGSSYTDEDGDPRKAAAAQALAPVARPERRWTLRECRHCGALFAQTASGPPAAEDLFEATLHLDRISVEEAIGRLPTESPYAQEERTVEQVLALLFGRACFLSNFARVQHSRGGEERFIFREADVILDAWHVQETNALGALRWYAIDDFRNAAPTLFPGGAVSPRLVGPMERIPPAVREQAPRRHGQIQELCAALNDGTRWVRLDSTPRKRQAGSFLYRAAGVGWLYVSCTRGRVTTVKADDDEMAMTRLDGALRANAATAAEPVSAAALARLRQIGSAVVDAFARLEKGEGCAHVLGTMAMVRGSFVVADVAGGSVRNLAEMDRTRALDHLAAEAARRRGVTFVPIAPDDRDRVGTLLDPEARWELFLAGRVVVGGGTTTEMQWMLSRQDGRFRRDGKELEWLDEAYARRIVCEKQYGWLRVR